jgi:hypothetical protein
VDEAHSWEQRDALITFRNLPKRYSCEDLRTRVRDVMLRVGARQDISIVPSRCQRALGAMARSPRVRVRFFIPAEVIGGTQREIRIEPGAPHSLDASDCALVRQMLTVLPGRVRTYRLACRAPGFTRPAFTVTVQTVSPPEDAPAQINPAKRTRDERSD